MNCGMRWNQIWKRSDTIELECYDDMRTEVENFPVVSVCMNRGVSVCMSRDVFQD